MRIVLSSLSLAIVIIAVGCQQRANPETSNQLNGEDSSIATVEAVRPEEAQTKPDVVESAGVNAPDSQPHAGHGMGRGRGRGMGMGMGMGMGRGPGGMSGMQGDMTTLHTMFAARDKIKRTVKNLPDGAEATTESDDEQIAGLIQEHVPAMEGRVMENNPLPPMTFHPVFIELIKYSEDYELSYEETDKGIKVTYKSDDPFVIMLVQEHAKLVSRFIKNGMEEVHNPYTLPQMNESKDESSPATKETLP